jgi:hypothetical protein
MSQGAYLIAVVTAEPRPGFVLKCRMRCVDMIVRIDSVFQFENDFN